MSCKSLLSTFLLCLFVSCLAAQNKPHRPPVSTRYFIDADVGGFVLPDYSPIGFTHAAIGSGYRFGPASAVGLEYRRTNYNGNGDDDYGRGIGLVYRLTVKNFYLKWSIGKVVRARRKTFESSYKYDYSGGGDYQGLTLGYRFRSGILLGLSGSGFLSQRYDRSEFIVAPAFQDDADNIYIDVTSATAEMGEFIPAGTISQDFFTFTLTIGYAFPGRGRKN